MLETTRTRALSEPAAVVAALWVQEWLGGRAAADDLLDVLTRIAPDTPAVLHDHGESLPAQALLHRLRTAQVTYAWPVLPRPGRTVGWPALVPDPSPAVLVVGPATSTDLRPLEARLLLRVGSGGWLLDHLRPTTGSGQGTAVQGTDGHGPAAEPDPTPDLVTLLTADALGHRAATRRFTGLLDDAATDLGRLGLDRPATNGAPTRWTATLQDLPRTADGSLVTLLQRSAVVLDALDQALRDDGAAVTAGEARARSARVHRLRGELCDLVCAATVGVAVASPSLRP